MIVWDRNKSVLNVNEAVQATRAEGPGLRTILWLQGCVRHCPGCINLDTHALDPRHLISVDDLIEWTLSRKDIEGVTISGGEPLLQATPLADYLEVVHEAGLSVILYTGYLLEEIIHSGTPDQKRCLLFTDLLIDGPFEKDQLLPSGLRGSSNQRFHFLTNHFTPEDIETYENHIEERGTQEIIIRNDGTVILVGWREKSVKC